MEAHPTVFEQTEAGWKALGDGHWEAAESAFRHALELQETAEALEGLSWSAWWLDDAETVSRSREQAYRLYRRNGDSAAAARMATWLASDALDFHGAPAVAGGWLQRAHRLLDPLERGPDHGWLCFHEGFLARIRSEHGTAIELARGAAACGRDFSVPDLEMLGLALEGATLVDCAPLADGMRCLDEATATGRREARARGVELEWVQADVQDLPFEDAMFDVVTSSLGAMLAPDHRVTARELLRVCRPGGTIGMLNFTPGGLAGRFFGVVATYLPPPPADALPPLLWGDEGHVCELFADCVDSLSLTRDTYVERAASPAEYIELFTTTFGPVVAIRENANLTASRHSTATSSSTR